MPVGMEAKVQKGKQAENESACCCQECKMDSGSPVCLRTAAASEDVPKNDLNGNVSAYRGVQLAYSYANIFCKIAAN